MYVPGDPLKGGLTFKLITEVICLERSCPEIIGGGRRCVDRVYSSFCQSIFYRPWGEAFQASLSFPSPLTLFNKETGYVFKTHSQGFGGAEGDSSAPTANQINRGEKRRVHQRPQRPMDGTSVLTWCDLGKAPWTVLQGTEREIKPWLKTWP